MVNPTFDLGCSIAAVCTAQPILGLLLEQRLTEGFRFFGELGRIGLERFAHPSIHFFTLHLLLPSAERSLAFNHFVDQATKTEEIRAERVLLVVNYFRSCKEEEEEMIT